MSALESMSFDSTGYESVTYRNGDHVVLPPYGVGVVTGQTTRTVAGTDFEYYEVNFPNGTSKAYVPVTDPQQAGMRPAVSETQIDIVLERFWHGRIDLPKQWAARQRKVSEILTSGDTYDIAVLASELRHWDMERGLPDLDRQAYRRALRLLCGEISAVMAISLEAAQTMMQLEPHHRVN